MPIEWSKYDGEDIPLSERVKCPQCGKVVSRKFPYCEFCTFPIGEMLLHGENSNFVKNKLKEEKKRRAQKRSSALENLKMSRSTVVSVVKMVLAVSFIVFTWYALNSLWRKLPSTRHEDGGMSPVVAPPPKNNEIVSLPRTEQNSPDPAPSHAEPDTAPSHAESDTAPSHEEDAPRSNQPEEETPWASKPTVPKQTWTRPKDWYEAQCREIQDDVATVCSGGYLYDNSKAIALTSKLKMLQNAIAEDNASDCNALYFETARQYKAFAESCRWQSGLRHTKYPHIVSSSQHGIWKAEKGYEFVNPGTSDLTVKEKVQQLSHPYDWYERECNVISENIWFYQNGPYSYDDNLANQTLTKARQLKSKLHSEKPKIIDALCSELQESYRQFKTTCKWRAGIKHPSIAHVISSERENTWKPEYGWEFVYPGTSNLAVRRIKLMQICDKCKGNGRITLKQRCLKCNGRGRMKNPAEEVEQAVNNVADTVEGKNARRIRRLPTGPRFVPCTDCAGRGFMLLGVNCDKCSGTGKLHK